MSKSCCNTEHPEHSDRRTLLKAALGVAALGSLGGGLLLSGSVNAASLTREERDKLTPEQIIQGMKQGNVILPT